MRSIGLLEFASDDQELVGPKATFLLLRRSGDLRAVSGIEMRNISCLKPDTGIVDRVDRCAQRLPPHTRKVIQSIPVDWGLRIESRFAAVQPHEATDDTNVSIRNSTTA
jgi:hypothetical protein